MNTHISLRPLLGRHGDFVNKGAQILRSAGRVKQALRPVIKPVFEEVKNVKKILGFARGGIVPSMPPRRKKSNFTIKPVRMSKRR